MTSLIIGRVVGVFTLNTMIIEVSTIFVNNRLIFLELGIDKSKEYIKRFKINGILLMSTFFVGRVLFLGVILGKYLLPAFINYDYD